MLGLASGGKDVVLSALAIVQLRLVSAAMEAAMDAVPIGCSRKQMVFRWQMDALEAMCPGFKTSCVRVPDNMFASLY